MLKQPFRTCQQTSYRICVLTTDLFHQYYVLWHFLTYGIHPVTAVDYGAYPVFVSPADKASNTERCHEGLMACKYGEVNRVHAQLQRNQTCGLAHVDKRYCVVQLCCCADSFNWQNGSAHIACMSGDN